MSDLCAGSGVPEAGWPAPSAEADQRWFQTVFQEHYAGLCTYVDRLVGSPAASEDVVQDLFVAVWERRAEWRARGKTLAPVLYISARNRAFNALKRRRVEDRSQLLLGVDDRAPGDTDDVLRSGELKLAIDRAVDALPEQCRRIFMLSRRDGLTYTQIASTLGLSVKTVETQMGRALKAMRARLSVHMTTLAALFILRVLG
ncbi:RNA polymerase sigma-70 factor [Longimicrobium terrae]|uniref:RNA polymerase sigma-70 factor (ECF subfamily) n=1 Tax=Longimicrobium terrae TaxID=1639882 RepID=A0A841H346_9BACT|nr:RNA polymerase sigma-70 factor [Longimicrobium terrae]MBB4638075.1 RNA polymerase sigma-70 factor (ECF subfamily) [Longimicrobium terrae]MBB6072447.1 RNA polymerase sigma-70 factor (ECF subfamily) [Longimicrobium terrae]NNC32139.1 RNA polymerase sigma-70 factor [Longimicrobium terrae]